MKMKLLRSVQIPDFYFLCTLLLHQSHACAIVDQLLTLMLKLSAVLPATQDWIVSIINKAKIFLHRSQTCVARKMQCYPSHTAITVDLGSLGSPSRQILYLWAFKYYYDLNFRAKIDGMILKKVPFFNAFNIVVMFCWVKRVKAS